MKKGNIQNKQRRISTIVLSAKKPSANLYLKDDNILQITELDLLDSKHVFIEKAVHNT